MEVRAKFTLHDGTTSAVLKVDGAVVVDDAIARSFPCPDDPGFACLDLTLPPTDVGHIFRALLVANPGAVASTISVPASAGTGSTWHPLYAPGLLGVFFMAMLVAPRLRRLRWRRR